ncbi:MAG: YidC/Oxa1 family rane protein insertase [Cryptosporangiaceae bacterium]|nr:YidC/Oxa1 family rane protein insertase [Cryptosporangiaceae bacterium]
MLDFLYIAVSWILLRWHDLFHAIGVGTNWAWVLAVVFLVITARLLLFRLFIKQVHYTRNMQKMQPKIQKLREKHKNDRAALNREMMKLQQEEGFNPLSGCLPMFLQIPVFLGLYHVLRHLSNVNTVCQRLAAGQPIPKSEHLLNLYTFSQSDTCDASKAKMFDAPLAASFHDSSTKIRELLGDPTSTRWVLLVLLVVSSAATLATQLMVKANATPVPAATAATIQKLMMWVIPIGVLASGLLFNFPLGVLLYWFTSNLWTLAQQGYIIRYHPPAEEVTASVGELGKTLAPKPGQRPVRMSKGSTDAGKKQPEPAAADPAVPPARSTTPRPGQKPSRPTGNRPQAKRPTQAKKRR